MRTSLIVAADLNDCIGVNGKLPWHLPGDLAHFRELTTGHVVIAGSSTQESIVEQLGHPLPRRITIVVSRSARSTHGSVVTCHSPELALMTSHAIEAFAGGDQVFVIGGAQIYAQLLPRVDRIHLTLIHARVNGDAFMPKDWHKDFEQGYASTLQTGPHNLGYSFHTYARRTT